MTKTDTVHRNARIHTLDPARPWASVLLVADGRIAAVGDEELLDRVEGTPETVDHGGAFLMPGLADVHNHHLLAGRADLYELQLDGAADLAGLLDAVRAWSRGLPENAWVVGGGWGSPLIPGAVRPESAGSARRGRRRPPGAAPRRQLPQPLGQLGRARRRGDRRRRP
ncbi:amidohydrolase family protein [Pseudonocardia terrae]|uniref:amidohydrolase family protein n=1 Tax=Pseudonocardia terrae TaxID=2905831 RepID=UPI0027E045E8|nr:amidohydrolase family protein [Pseudonocardia terrae]